MALRQCSFLASRASAMAAFFIAWPCARCAMSSSGGTTACTASTARLRGSVAHSATASAALPCELAWAGVRRMAASSGSAPASHSAGGPAASRAQAVISRTQLPSIPPPPPSSSASASVSPPASPSAAPPLSPIPAAAPAATCAFAPAVPPAGSAPRPSSASMSLVSAGTARRSRSTCATMSADRLAPFASTASARRRSRREAPASTSHGTSSGPISGAEIAAMPSGSSERLLSAARVFGSSASARTRSRASLFLASPAWALLFPGLASRARLRSASGPPTCISWVRKADEVERLPMAVAHDMRTSRGAATDAARATMAAERGAARLIRALDLTPHESAPTRAAAAPCAWWREASASFSGGAERANSRTRRGYVSSAAAACRTRSDTVGWLQPAVNSRRWAVTGAKPRGNTPDDGAGWPAGEGAGGPAAV
mmetsp:Transcript_32527/g.105069  ORF Transcript_32527/g.105069 Transcript_32527/m.105069 type:complete len:430 (-) Transcript_32527:1552-2841(-)